MTQMVLATGDRDNSRLSHIYDEEEDPAVISGPYW